MNSAFVDYMRQGGLAAWPLALCSIVSIAIIVERGWYVFSNNRKVKKLTNELFSCIAKGDIDGAVMVCKTHPVGDIYESIINNLKRPVEEVIVISERKRLENMQNFKKYVWVLGTVGSLAPFIGLMGTVLGIMDSFKSIAISGSGGFTVVSAGISEALIATAGGLIIAIYSVFAYNFFTVRMNNIAMYIKTRSETLLDDLKNMK